MAGSEQVIVVPYDIPLGGYGVKRGYTVRVDGVLWTQAETDASVQQSLECSGRRGVGATPCQCLPCRIYIQLLQARLKDKHARQA